MKEEKFKSFSELFIDGYLNDIFEKFNPPLEVSWSKVSDEWSGTFDINENKYFIMIKNYSQSNGNWLFKFKGNDSFDLVGDIKKAYTVLPTIKKSIVDFMDEMDPEVLFFIAADESIGRKKIYDRFCVEFSKSRFLYYYTEQYKNTKFFILTKHDYDGVEFANTISKIRKEYQV